MQKPGKSAVEESNADANNEKKVDRSDEGSSEESSESSEEKPKDGHQRQNEDLHEEAANKDNMKCKEVRPTTSYTTQTIDEHSSYYSREVAEMYNVEVRTGESVLDLSIPREICKVERSRPRRLIMVRHAERMERVFPAWLRLATTGDRYTPYNLGQPRSVPIRSGGMDAFHDDPSITRFGGITAELIGREIAAMKFPITGVYSSPALRCIETAHEFLKVLDSSVGETKIEYGLFEWLGWYEQMPQWMSVTELRQNNFCIDANYKPVYDSAALLQNREENTHDFYKRSAEVVCKILSRSSGAILIITHGPTIDASVRHLLKLGKTVPRWEELDAIGVKYPYCSTVVLEQDATGARWKLAAPLKCVTFLNQTTQPDYRFLQRKCLP